MANNASQHGREHRYLAGNLHRINIGQEHSSTGRLTIALHNLPALGLEQFQLVGHILVGLGREARGREPALDAQNLPVFLG